MLFNIVYYTMNILHLSTLNTEVASYMNSLVNVFRKCITSIQKTHQITRPGNDLHVNIPKINVYNVTPINVNTYLTKAITRYKLLSSFVNIFHHFTR